MLKPKEHFHGSDLEQIEKTYRIPTKDIISFSANVNPLGISYKLKSTLASQIDAITTYPDREYTALRNSIGNYVNTSPDHIIVGNGATELISLSFQNLMPKKALLVSPTYSEYEREITGIGGTVEYYFLEEKHNFELGIEDFLSRLTKDLDLLILCNPNNPTSTALNTTQIEKILKECKKQNIFVLIDETYVEFVNDIWQFSSIPLTKDYDNVIVLRGISKFFAAPGLRLGYGVCSNEQLLDHIKNKKNPWTINTLASIAGEIMFSDKDYIAETRNLIHSERDRVCKRLASCSKLKVYEPTANFVLVKLVSTEVTSHELFEACIKKGLMIRDCSSFPGLDDSFFRICFMNPKQNDALLEAILDTLE